MVYAPVCTTNPQILIVICCIHLHIHHVSRIPFLIPSFLDLCVVRTLNASKPVVRHFNLPNHSEQHMAVSGLSLHQGSTENGKTLEQKYIFQIGALKSSLL